MSSVIVYLNGASTLINYQETLFKACKPKWINELTKRGISGTALHISNNEIQNKKSNPIHL